MNFPRQSVTDASDVVRPFTLRGLSPDHTLVLVTAGAATTPRWATISRTAWARGASGVDLNTIPVERARPDRVLRDGAAGAVRLRRDRRGGEPGAQGRRVHSVRERRRGPLRDPRLPRRRHHGQRERRLGHSAGRGSLGLFGEFRDRQPTNRAWADPSETPAPASRTRSTTRARWSTRTTRWSSPTITGATGWSGTRSPSPTSACRWASGGTEIYSFGGYSHRNGVGNPTAGTPAARAAGTTSTRSASCPTSRAW